jgi:hypothetical protein
MRRPVLSKPPAMAIAPELHTHGRSHCDACGRPALGSQPAPNSAIKVGDKILVLCEPHIRDLATVAARSADNLVSVIGDGKR